MYDVQRNRLNVVFHVPEECHLFSNETQMPSPDEVTRQSPRPLTESPLQMRTLLSLTAQVSSPSPLLPAPTAGADTHAPLRPLERVLK